MPVRVLDGVCVRVPDCVTVCVTVPDCDAVVEAVVEDVMVRLGVIFPEAVCVIVPVRLTVGVRAAVLVKELV